MLYFKMAIIHDVAAYVISVFKVRCSNKVHYYT